MTSRWQVVDQWSKINIKSPSFTCDVISKGQLTTTNLFLKALLTSSISFYIKKWRIIMKYKNDCVWSIKDDKIDLWIFHDKMIKKMT